MKPFPQKSWPKSYGQSSGKKLTQNKEGFLLRSRFADGTLIKFPRLLPWNRKSSPLCRTLRLTRKSILIKKKKKEKKKKQNGTASTYIFTCLQSSRGNEHN